MHRRPTAESRRSDSAPPAAGTYKIMTRIGLVLGAGGVTGEAFHRGVLWGLRDVTGWDARTAETIVGTSAGSLLGASLRAPVANPTRVPTTAQRPVRRVEGFGAFSAAARRPWRVRPVVLAAALAPAGRQSVEVVTDGLRRRFGLEWPAEELWVVAARRRDGARVVFGRRGAPRTDVASAVAASCAIPGYFRPVVIDGDAYVDGGIHSPTNADLLAGRELDLVVVSSPLSLVPSAARPRIDLSLRLLWHRYVAAETRAIRRQGTPVLVIEPDAALLGRLGVNTMRTKHLDDIEDLAQAATTRLLRRASSADAVALLHQEFHRSA